MISSSTGINKIAESDPFRKYVDKDVKFRIMTQSTWTTLNQQRDSQNSTKSSMFPSAT
jgi:hypothetical protein